MWLLPQGLSGDWRRKVKRKKHFTSVWCAPAKSSAKLCKMTSDWEDFFTIPAGLETESTSILPIKSFNGRFSRRLSFLCEWGGWVMPTEAASWRVAVNCEEPDELYASKEKCLFLYCKTNLTFGWYIFLNSDIRLLILMNHSSVT